MDSRNSLREQDASNRVNNRVIEFFPQRAKAYEAIGELRLAGFTHNEIGFVSLDDSSDQSGISNQPGISSGTSSVSGTNSYATSDSASHDKSFWKEVKDFFSGDSHDDDRETSNYYSSDAEDFSSYSSDLNLSSDRGNYYSQGIN